MVNLPTFDLVLVEWRIRILCWFESFPGRVACNLSHMTGHNARLELEQGVDRHPMECSMHAVQSVLILESISHIDFLQSRLSLLLSLCHCKVPCHCPALCGMAEHKLLRRCPPLFNSRENGMLLWQDAFYSLPQQNGAFECPSSRIHLSGILASSIHVYASIKLTGKIMKFSLVLHFLTQKGGRTKQEEGNVRRSI